MFAIPPKHVTQFNQAFSATIVKPTAPSSEMASITGAGKKNDGAGNSKPHSATDSPINAGKSALRHRTNAATPQPVSAAAMPIPSGPR